jgi:hypothetical protein
MSVSKHLLLDIFLKCSIASNNLSFQNKNVGIKFSAHDTFLDYPSSGTLKVERLENQIISKVLEASKPKD